MPFNFRRHGHFILNQSDEKLQDLETVTTDYSEGLRQNEPTNWRVEEVKWNTRHAEQNAAYFASLPAFREDAVQFASILHKRRFRKFDLEFVASSKPEEQELYIIRFRTHKKRFGYTNRWYPTDYSGLVYVNKSDLAVVKLVQRWEMEFEEKDVEKVAYWLGEFKEEFRGKTETTSVYRQQEDGLYYPTEYFVRRYTEKTNLDGEYVNYTFEGRSELSGYTRGNLEEFIWEDRKKDSAQDRVEQEGLQ